MRAESEKAHTRRTVTTVVFLPESAGATATAPHTLHDMGTTITTPSSRAVVSLTPSLRTMTTASSDSNIYTLTVNTQQVSTQLFWKPHTPTI